MTESNESTEVTGAPTGISLPEGEVVGERYEVIEPHRDDLFTFDYRAFDHETEQHVLLRIVQQAVLDDPHVRHELVPRMQDATGFGGRFLPGLLEADRDGGRVFIVEPWPQGACLREVLDQRIPEGRLLTAAELLPVVSRLSAALEALPPHWYHGDVRAEQIWIDRNQLWLVGPFLLSAVPAHCIGELLQTNQAVRRRLPPEIARTGVDAPGDRFGVAAVTWEALTGRAPDEPAAGALGEVGEVLRGLLAPEPARRSPSLQPLLEALARKAGLPVPQLDPEPFRQATAERNHADTVPRAREPKATIPDGVPAPSQRIHREPASTLPMGSQRVDRDETPTEQDRDQTTRRMVATQEDPAPAGADPNDTAPHRAVEVPTAEESTGEATDPQAPAAHAASDGPHAESSSNSRSPGAELDVTDATPSPVGPDDAPTRPRYPQPPPERTKGQGTMELGVDDLEMVEAQATAPDNPPVAHPEQASSASPGSSQENLKQTTTPEGVQPIPRPRKPSYSQTPESHEVLFDDSSGSESPAQAEAAPDPDATPGAGSSPSKQPPAPSHEDQAEPSSESAAPRAGKRAPAPTHVPGVGRTPDRTRTDRRRAIGILTAAFLLAAAIIATSLYIRHSREARPERAPASSGVETSTDGPAAR